MNPDQIIESVSLFGCTSVEILPRVSFKNIASSTVFVNIAHGKCTATSFTVFKPCEFTAVTLQLRRLGWQGTCIFDETKVQVINCMDTDTGCARFLYKVVFEFTVSIVKERGTQYGFKEDANYARMHIRADATDIVGCFAQHIDKSRIVGVPKCIDYGVRVLCLSRTGVFNMNEFPNDMQYRQYGVEINPTPERLAALENAREKRKNKTKAGKK